MTATQVRVRIGALRITAASAIEARRLADALPAALERAMARWPGEPATRGRPTARADRVADEIVRAAFHAGRSR